LFAIRSGPLSTCVGTLSAIASSSSVPVITQQEKSRPVLRITERPARTRVLDIFRTIAVKRLERTARSTGSMRGAGTPNGSVSTERLRSTPPERPFRQADYDRPAVGPRRRGVRGEQNRRAGKLKNRRATDLLYGG